MSDAGAHIARVSQTHVEWTGERRGGGYADLICSMRSPLTSSRTKVSGFMVSPSPHQCTYVIDPEQSVSLSTPFSASSVGM